MKALLFINGDAPKTLPETDDYKIIGCTDGAFHYLQEKHFDLKKLDIISGDFDSNKSLDELEGLAEKFSFEIIETPDQNKTDFEKALDLLVEKKVKEVDVFGGSGKEMDHFLGNLTTATKFFDQMNIKFIDDFSTYYFLKNHEILNGVEGKMISLYPFPSAEKVITKGLNWNLNQENLSISEKISTRNFAKDNEVEISFEAGRLLVFIGKENYR